MELIESKFMASFLTFITNYTRIGPKPERLCFCFKKKIDGGIGAGCVMDISVVTGIGLLSRTISILMFLIHRYESKRRKQGRGCKRRGGRRNRRPI